MNTGRYYIMTYYQILSCLKLLCFFLTNTHLEEIIYHAYTKRHINYFIIELIINLLCISTKLLGVILYIYNDIDFGFTFKTAHTLQCTHSMDQNPYNIVVRSKKTAY